MDVASDILESAEYRGAVTVVRCLRDAGFKALVVGGAPRDLVLGDPPADYDIATDARPEQVRSLFEKTIPVGEQFGVILVILDGLPYEVATFRADDEYRDGRRPVGVRYCSEREDALRRDFTVNALMFDPIESRIIDYVDGLADLRARRIRTVGNPLERFGEDHLRLVRAVRFAARLDFEIGPRTREAIVQQAHTIVRVAAERIAAELVKILTGPRAGQALRMLSELGLLKHLLPEIEAMHGVEQPPNFHPEGDVFIHTCLLLDYAENPTPTLALAALLHDVAKPDTQEFAPDRIRFSGHCEQGAEMAAEICKRLKMSRAITTRVEYLVANHLRIKDALEMRPARMKRFMRHEAFPELLELFRLDTLASHGRLDTYEQIREAFEELSAEEIAPPPLLRGSDLIEMGYEPGPLFSEILEGLETAQLENEIRTPDEAKWWVREHFKSKD